MAFHLNAMSRNGIVYLVTCPNGLSYVGKTVQKLSTRISQHKAAAASTRAIRDAFHKHGDAMKVSVLMRCEEDDLDMNESLYIEMLDTVHPRGYNLRCGKMAAMSSTNQALSTHVHTPVPYDSEEDCRGVVAAVAEDVRNICRDAEVKPWAGVVKKSVKEVNKIRGARQFAGWAGPRKGMPMPMSMEEFIKRMCDGHDGYITLSPDDMKRYVSWSKLQMAYETRVEADTAKYSLESQKAALDLEVATRYATYKDNANKEKEKHALEADKRVKDAAARFSEIVEKVEAMQKLGMHEEVNALKRKLADM